MPRLHAEALVFCLAWIALAVTGAALAGFYASAALVIVPMLIIMPASSLILSKTGNFSLERQVRWGILALAAAALLVWLNA